jgi:hypothetical protein
MGLTFLKTGIDWKEVSKGLSGQKFSIMFDPVQAREVGTMFLRLEGSSEDLFTIPHMLRDEVAAVAVALGLTADRENRWIKQWPMTKLTSNGNLVGAIMELLLAFPACFFPDRIDVEWSDATSPHCLLEVDGRVFDLSAFDPISETGVFFAEIFKEYFVLLLRQEGGTEEAQRGRDIEELLKIAEVPKQM